MNKIQFWKNFKLLTELEIAGRFIYNGLRCFHEMDTLYYEEEIFEVLYNLSVGFERLLKIAVILNEHDKSKNQDEFEKSLITHNHLELLKRLRDKYMLKIAGSHNEFLQMLSVFYKTHRYGRFSIESINTTSQEKLSFHAYLKKHLKIEINDEFPYLITPNSSQFRKFVGRIVGKISTQLFDIITKEASRLNINTDEIRCNSKAAKIFLSKEFDFNNEDVLWKELLIYILNTHGTSDYIEYIRSIEPLEFDPGAVGDYLQCFVSNEKKLDVIGELETLYEDLEKPGDRLNELSIIGNPSVCFDMNDKEEDDDA